MFVMKCGYKDDITLGGVLIHR